ncbi:MAG TPA: MFS transporter [Thermoanaerobaculia bacterium]|nr:MFS transporter [Thermoanaerobaculia bacterium]
MSARPGGVRNCPAMAESGQRRPGTWESLRAALGSRRIGAVAIQSFSSGLPLGLVWIALPAYLTYRGVDIRTVGLFSLAQAPWTFKFLWAPLLDRFEPRFLGRKRSWIVVWQGALLAGTGLLAAAGASPSVGAIAGLALLVAFASASQDVVIDGYAVDVLETSEQGLAVGARVALYRGAMLLSGAVAITLGQRFGWPAVFAGLALLYVPLAGAVVWSPPPPPDVARPPRTLREAVFEPLVDIFRRSRALQIIAFLLLYKFGENLATALTRPFLIQKCFAPEDVGLATASIGLAAAIVGTFVGGSSTHRLGLTRALWLFGAIQAVGFLGYAVVDRMTPGTPCGGGLTAALVQPPVNRLVMYAAVAVENAAQGMASGAFGVLLLRLTQKQFSSTQYALFSSIFALGRVLAGPPAGFLADAVGWTPFFLLSVLASVPGLVLLHKFAPLSAPEPELDADARVAATPVSRGRLAAAGLAWAAGGFLGSVATAALLGALKAARTVGAAFDYVAALGRLASPAAASDWIRLGSFGVVGLLTGAAAAAFLAARHGVRPRA